MRYGIIWNRLVHVGPYDSGAAYDSLASWQATWQDAHSSSSVQSPFVDESVPALDFRLKAGCAAIDAGTSDGAPAGDWFGCGRWDDPLVGTTGGGARPYVDIGACEYLTADADTDGDGVVDYDEIAYDGIPLLYTPGFDLDPLNPDTDGDGVSDGVELGCPGGNPLGDDASPCSFPVNFQPSDPARVTDSLPDLGLSFTPARGYGWL